MKIYINNDYNIISIDKEPKEYFRLHETYGDIKESNFYNMCDTCMHLWKHEPQYKIKLDKDYNIIRDSIGQIVYELDENGNKKEIGWATYPSMDLNIISSIQMEYDRQQLEAQEIMQSVIDSNYRLSVMELKL